MSPRTHRPLTVAALLLALFVAAMEMTVVSTAMPTAVGDLGGLHLYAWAFAAYMLTATVTVPIYGKLADLRGRKPVMLAGIALFLGGSAACGWARSMEALILFRAVQGLGAGAMQPMSLTIVGDLFDVHQRARMQALFSSVWALAGLVGPLLGGAIVKVLSWRWVFWVNLPVGLAAAALLAIFFHERVERHEHKLDLAGAALLSAAVVLLLTAARSRETALAAAPAAAAALGLFLLVERRAREPLLPLDLFAQREVSVSSLVNALLGAAMFSTVTYVPLYVQAVLGADPTGAGSAIAPMAIGWPIASALGGRLLHRTGYRAQVVGGSVLSVAAALLLATFLRPGVPLLVPQALTALFGLGLGFTNTSLMIAVQASVPWNRRGVATAGTVFFRTIGGTVAVGVLGALLAAALAAQGGPRGAVDQILGGHGSGVDPGVAAALAATLAPAMGTIFWAVAALAFASFAVALFFPPVPVDRRAPVTPPASAAPAGPPEGSAPPERAG